MTTAQLTYIWAKDNEFQLECTIMALNDLLSHVACCRDAWDGPCVKLAQNNRAVEIRQDTRLKTGTVPGKPGHLVTLI